MSYWFRYWVIPASLIVALMLTMLPLPVWAQPFRPGWVTMVVIYWTLALPRVFGIGAAWFSGLFLDVVQGALLGQHALGIAVVAYIALRLHQRIRVYPAAQQSLVVFLLLFTQQTIVLWISGAIGQTPDSVLLYYAPSGVGMLLWPWLFAILRSLRRKQKLR